MTTKRDKRNGLCIIVVLCLVHQILEELCFISMVVVRQADIKIFEEQYENFYTWACPRLEESSFELCQTPEDCCFLEPNYPIYQNGDRCLHGCSRVCYIDKKNCANPCNSVVFDIQSCLNPDPEHCDVIPNTEVVQGQECFTGCRRICDVNAL